MQRLSKFKTKQMTIYSPDFFPITSYLKEYSVISWCHLISEALFFSTYSCGFSHDYLCYSSVDSILLFVLHTRTHLLDAVSCIFAPMVSLIHTIYSSFHGPIAAHSKLQVLYSPRDYRSEGASGSEWKEVTVRSSTEVLFQPDNSTKVRKFKLSSVVSLTLSA